MLQLGDVAIASTLSERARGLLGTDREHMEAGALLITPCSAVHTIGMRYPIDVAFLASGGLVLSVHHWVRPGRLHISHKGAEAVLERPARVGSWLAPGDTVSIARDTAL